MQLSKSIQSEETLLKVYSRRLVHFLVQLTVEVKMTMHYLNSYDRPTGTNSKY